MPYRALLMSIVTVAVAFIAVGMWVRAVEPWVAVSQAATQEAARQGSPEYSTTLPATATHPMTSDKALRAVVKGTLVLAFILICTLLMVGFFFATYREWIRFRANEVVRRGNRTPYVDAWKIAAERMNVEGEEREGGEFQKFGPDDEPPEDSK